MRIGPLFCFWGFCLFASAQSIDTIKISINVTNHSTEEILRKIEAQCALSFSYQASIFDNEKMQSISCTQCSLQKTLNTLFSNNYKYKLVNKNIIIHRIKNNPPPKIQSIKYDLEITQPVIKENTHLQTSLKKYETLYPIKPVRCFVVNNDITHLLQLKDGNIEHPPIESSQRNKKTYKKHLSYGLSINPGIGLHKDLNTNFSYGVSTQSNLQLGKHSSIAVELSFLYQTLTGDYYQSNRIADVELENIPSKPDKKYEATLFLPELYFKYRYDFVIRKKTRYFTSIGGSLSYTYINYHYYYNNSKVKYGTYYKLGIVDFVSLHIGMEKASKNWKNCSYQIAPFIKYGLNKLGPDDLKFLFTGISMGIIFGSMK